MYYITISNRPNYLVKIRYSDYQLSEYLPMKKFIHDRLISVLNSPENGLSNGKYFSLTPDKSFIKYIINDLITKIQIGLSDPYSTIKFTDNSYYYFGWKQIYNRFYFLGINQKSTELKPDNARLYNSLRELDKTISLLQSGDIEFIMTTFSYILFSVTKSLYKVPKNSFSKDIRLLISSRSSDNSKICKLIENMIKSIVDPCIYFDYDSGKSSYNLKEDYILPRLEKDNTFNNNNQKPDENKFIKDQSKIKNTKYTTDFIDYPILINNKTNATHNPNKVFSFCDFSPIFVGFVPSSAFASSMNISVTPTSITSADPTPWRTQYINFLERKLSDLAHDKYNSKSYSNQQEVINEMIDSIIPPSDPIHIFTNEEYTKISNRIFKILFPRNQHILYFDNLYKIAYKTLSAPDSDPDLVRIYSYLLASLTSFKEYIDQFNYTNLHLTYLYSEDLDEKAIWENIDRNKKTFEELYYKTIEIFKNRCTVNSPNNHTVTYEEQTILYFDQFLSELTDNCSDLIILPSKKKNDLIFLDFHRYFEQFELFLAKKGFDYDISKQKFNRILYDNKILKPRYNGNDKTPPKLDYIMKSNKKEYTVLAIRLEILKFKCDELSK